VKRRLAKKLARYPLEEGSLGKNGTAQQYSDPKRLQWVRRFSHYSAIKSERADSTRGPGPQFDLLFRSPIAFDPTIYGGDAEKAEPKIQFAASNHTLDDAYVGT